MHDNIEKIATQTPDLAMERQEQLRALFPEAWNEGQLDFAKLRTLLEEITDDNPERYRFEWAGKREALQLLQTRSHATLVPTPEQSLDFDATRNWFIEGDNLEVLKLLYKPLFGRVKMIYIDPPYNTGNDFIYPDNFADPLKNYLIQTGQKDPNGDLQVTNPDTAGRVHSRWLSMLYPRLTLARSLLRDDGVIFVSIDDNEVHHLRLLMNEVFGEENFVGQLIWEKGRKNDAKLFSFGHEYMLVFARSLATLKELKTIWREEKPGAREIMDKTRELFGHEQATEETVQKSLRTWFSALPNNHPSKKLSRYKNIDKYSLTNGPWRDGDISWPGGGGPRYDVVHDITQIPCKVPERGWIFSTLEVMNEKIKLGLVEFREDETQPPFRKRHLVPIAEELADEDEDDDEIENEEVEGSQIEDEEEEDDESVGMQVVSSVIYKQSQVAVKYLRELMGAKVFDNPKDHEVLKRLIRYCTSSKENHIVLDFFAGSGSTGEAVLQANREDNGNRRFVCVQLP